MNHYEIVLWWSETDRVFVAEAPELPGCIAHGGTRESALANITEAMELWLDVAARSGNPIPQPRDRDELKS